MRKLLSSLALMVFIALPALAEGSYTFQLRLTDGKTALTANPKLAELKMPEDKLAAAANDRVMLFDHTTGAAWDWLMLSWIDKEPPVEQYLNAQGAATAANGDIAFSAGANHSVRVRCLRGTCRVSASATTGGRSFDMLQKGESVEFTPDTTIKISVQPR